LAQETFEKEAMALTKAQEVELTNVEYLAFRMGQDPRVLDVLRGTLARFSKITLPKTNRDLCPTEVDDFLKYQSDFQSLKAKSKSSFHPFGKRDGRMVASTRKADEALTGVNIDAVDKYSDALLCPICHLPAVAGVMIKTCAHHFHGRCLAKATETSKRCPVCRSNFESGDAIPIKDVKEARFLCQSLDDLKVQCPMGCPEQVRWASLEGHLRDDCSLVELYCKYGGCKFKGLSSQVHEHEEETCGEALVECACGEYFHRKVLDEHKSTNCTMQSIPCMYCQKDGIARSLMKAHYVECSGAVPMSEVSKLISRIDLLEGEVQQLKRKRED